MKEGLSDFILIKDLLKISGLGKCKKRDVSLSFFMLKEKKKKKGC
jgi:hypothetical protein